MRNVTLLTILLMVCSKPMAASETLSQYVPEANLVGSARMSFFLWDVYDATLYATHGQWQPDKPFALTLRYLRDIEGEAIADRTAREIRRQGPVDEVRLAAWYSQMRVIFPDVSDGTELTGIYSPGRATRFLQDGNEIGTIQDPEFGVRFFAIWLGEKTSEPALRRQLLGLR